MKTREERIEELVSSYWFAVGDGSTDKELLRLLAKGMARILVQDAVAKLLEENPDLLRDGTV